MSRTVRIILVSIGIFILVLPIVPFLIPVNQFRPSIEEKASAAFRKTSMTRRDFQNRDLVAGVSR